jgi:TPR repeat protein
MAQFISQLETHGSTAVTPKPNEIAALCSSLTSAVYSPTPEILRRAIETSIQTDVEMLYKLGTLHELGLHGLPKDVAKSLTYYELAASQDHLLSLTALASVYADMADQSEIAEYRVKAIKYFSLASDLGSIDAIFNLGVLAAKIDQEKALALWHQSAEHRHLPSLITLSDYYWVLKQYERAVPHLKVAADLGDERSQCLLATAHIGGLGVDRVDYDRAVSLLEPLALRGKSTEIMVTAATNLGNIHVNLKEFDRARHWYQVASSLEPKGGYSSKALQKMFNVEKYLEKEAEQQEVLRKVHTKLLGERKTSGRKCSSCGQFGYVGKNFIFCKCYGTMACCLLCSKKIAAEHSADCVRRVKEQQKKKKKQKKKNTQKLYEERKSHERQSRKH